MTLNEFRQLEFGMSYREVVGVIGHEGKEIVNMDFGNDEDLKSFSTVGYSWSNDDGSSVNATFQGGKLAFKAQFDLN